MDESEGRALTQEPAVEAAQQRFARLRQVADRLAELEQELLDLEHDLRATMADVTQRTEDECSKPTSSGSSEA